MLFEKAHKELLAGKKIRRKEWEKLMHLRLIDDDVIAFRGEFSNFYDTPNILISKDWLVVDGDGTKFNFLEAIDQLRNKKCLRLDHWEEDKFLFIDKDKMAVCKPVKFDFMPSWEELQLTDWEILK